LAAFFSSTSGNCVSYSTYFAPCRQIKDVISGTDKNCVVEAKKLKGKYNLPSHTF
jgi:hypothetical protein